MLQFGKYIYKGDRGSTVVKVLCYNSESVYISGTAVEQWLRCCATIRKVNIYKGDRGSTVVKVLCYKSEGTYIKGTAVAQWLRCCATNRKVAGSIPAGVTAFFIDIKSFRSHYGPGVDSASNRNEYQEYFLGVKRPVGKANNVTTILCRCHEI